MEWFSYVIAICIGFSAILSPWFVAKENNKHQLRLKKIENYELSKRKALETYIKCATCCCDSFAPGEKSSYYNSVYDLYVYFSDVPSEVDCLLDFSGTNDFNEQLQNIVQALSKQIYKE